MGDLDTLDILFIIFLGFCVVAVVYSLYVWLKAIARWERLTDEAIALQREANELLRDVSRKLNRE